MGGTPLAASGKGEKATRDRKRASTEHPDSHHFPYPCPHVSAHLSMHPMATGKPGLSIFSRPVYPSEHQGPGGALIAQAITCLPNKKQ